jgi:diguanylate cyclase (GGDEF)-like protein
VVHAPPIVRTWLPWLRTLRGSIVLGFVASCLLTAALGAGAVVTIRRAGWLVEHTFDRTVTATSYAAAAAADWAAIESTTARPVGAANPQAYAQGTLHLASLLQVLHDDLTAAVARVHGPQAVQAGQAALGATTDCGRFADRGMVADALDWAAFDSCSSIVSGQIELFVDRIADEGISTREQAMVTLAAGVQLEAITTLLALVLLVWVGWQLARRLMGPLAAAAGIAESIAAGRLDTIIPAGKPDELGALFAAMTLMRDSVRAKVESEVAQRRDAYAWLDAALENMAQGLTLFDADDRLRLANRRVAEIYRLPPEALVPGTSFETLLEHGVATGLRGTVTVADIMLRQRSNGNDWRASTSFEPLADGRLIRVVRRRLPDGSWVSTHEDVTERKQAEARAEFLIGHDALTGLANRTRFTERLEAAALRLAQGESFAVLLIDLDRFKHVNDVLGHSLGDRLLCAAADRLAARLREADTVARLNGDEFAVIQAPIERPAAASNLAERVMTMLAEPFDINGRRLNVGACVGVVVAPDHGDLPDLLLRNAEMALSRAKSEGRGTMCVFDPSMHASMQRPRELEASLRAAQIDQDFELLYQPVFDAELGGINGFEALLRWNHPTQGTISPAEFIPIAEETGLIASIGDWVLRQATRQAVNWPEPLSVAVNVSAVQFKGAQLIGAVTRALAESGIAPCRLELEITESVLLQDNSATLATLHQLRNLGVRTALDDFGTGYSSLSYLRSFPFDRIKIDQGFVRDLGKGRDALAIIRAISSLSRDLGIRATAEGVETAEQFERLRVEGCAEMQGYYFSRPIPPSGVEAVLRRWGVAGRARVVDAQAAA